TTCEAEVAGSPLPTIRINRYELSRLLRAFRARRNDTIAQVNQRLQQALQPGTGSSGLTGLGVKNLEDENTPRPSHLDPLLADLKTLADAYSVPLLMLDSLRAEPSDAICLDIRRDRLLTLSSPAATGHLGEGTCYQVPAFKLENTEETALVRLALEPGGHSA